MSKPHPSARAGALILLNGVTANRRLLTELLPKSVEHLSPPDRARAQRLATTTLRWADRADRMLGPYLRNRPEDPVLNALRLGVVEMAELNGDPHGVVHALVGIVKSTVSQSKSRLVNAVLRKIPGDLEKWPELPVPQMPKWLRRALRDAWGNDVVKALETAHSMEPPLDITPKPDAPGDLAQLGGAVLSNGTIRLTNRGQISKLPGYPDGTWWVQDAAASLPAAVLGAKAREAVLDLCAAPGGKTMQLAATGATVTALDDSERRMTRLRENLARTNLTAAITIADALEWLPKSTFDAILLDAPCSATGTIRRHPDLPYAKSMEDIAPLIPLQAALLDRALGFLRPGGRLVYCTCSLLPSEGEDQIAALFARYPKVQVHTESLNVSGIDKGWIGEFGVRTRPDFWADVGGMDGFFITCLRKHA